MDKEESQTSESNVRIQVHEEETDYVPTRSPLIGSGSKEEEAEDDDDIIGDSSDVTALKVVQATNGQLGVNFGMTVTSGDIVMSEPTQENGKLSDSVTDSDKGVDFDVSSSDFSSKHDTLVTASAQQEETVNECCKKDLEYEQQRPTVSPSFEGDSLSLQDRDPNYATQRPDTLGAINLVAQNPVAVATSAGKVFQNGSRIRRRGTGQGDALEDMMFDMAQLGRRTRGAGMDQLELNQHHLAVGSDDDSDSGDAAEHESTQCESTEADQYKMNPEADQSESARPDYADEPLDVIGRTVRSNARACSLVRGGRNLGRYGNRYSVEDDVDDGEIPDASEITEEDLEWERLHDPDLADRAEDDRQYSVAETNACQGVVTGAAKSSQPGIWMMGNDSSTAMTGASLHNVLLRQHPNSAFSQLKPDGSGLCGEAGSSIVNSNSLANTDVGKSLQCGKDKMLNVVVSLQDKPVVKPAALFKPILHEGKANCAGENLRKGLFPRQHSEGNASDNFSNFRFGSIAKHGKTLSDNGLRSQADREDSLVHSPRLLTSNPSFEAGSSESLHSYLPSRADHLMIGEPNTGHLARSLIASDYHQLQQHPAPLGCDYQSQATPPQKQTRPSYHMMNDSLELSPIRPPSSHALHHQQQQQSLSFIHSPGLASIGETFQAAAVADSNSRAHSYGCKTSSELGSEISDIQEVRTRLHGLLTLSDRTMPDKAHYDQTNDVELLTNHPGQLLIDQPSSWSLLGLHEALPLSSKYLLAGTNQTKLDVAVLAAENRALRDAMEQQRFKRKHCEKQIQQLQNKILELQENLTVAISIDRRKDLTIEQLDKALVKVAESWHQKESECHKILSFLQQENASLKQTLDSQQQVTSRLEIQISHTLQQSQLEQQRASQMFLSKDQHISELTLRCQQLQQMLDNERERWQQKLNDEQKETEKLKEKLQIQLEELRVAHQEDVNSWTEKEKQTLLKIEKIKDAHSKMIDVEKAKLEHQKQSYHDLEMVLRAAQAEVERLQLESETFMREKESLKVEIGLLEARHLSDLHQLETELQSSADKKLSAKLDELNRKHMETEHNLHDTHRLQLQELSQHHLEELEQLKDEHHSVVCDMEELFHQQQQIKESRIQELEKKVKTLVEEKEKIEIHKLELANQLKSLMQSHCEEALRLLRLTQPSSSLMDCPVSSSQQLHEPCQISKETNWPQEHQSCNQIFLSNDLHRKCGDVAHDSLPCTDGSPESMRSGMGQREIAVAINTSPSESSPQYTQFLASVRSYQPLLADLNASVASVANSVSTLGQASQRVHLENVVDSEPPHSTIAHMMPLQHVSFQRSSVASPVQQLQQSKDISELANNVQLSSNNGDRQQQAEENVIVNQRQRVTFEQHADEPRSVKSSADTDMTMFSSSRHKGGEKNVGFSNSQGTSLLNQILLHDTSNTSNTSDESVMEGIESCIQNDKSGLDKLIQQELRQQQLHQYIRMLLQRSPRFPTDDKLSCDNKLGHQNNLPDGKPIAHGVGVDKRVNGAYNSQPLAVVQLSSPEQDFQMHQTLRDINSMEVLSDTKESRRSTVMVQQNPMCQSADAEFSSASQPGDILSQQQILEICSALGHQKLLGINTSIETPSSSHLRGALPPTAELLGYLKSTYEQISQSKMSQSEQAHSPSEATEPLTDSNTKEGVLPKNHPNHQVTKLQDITVGIGVENATARQESLRCGKLNKPESTKPKNAVSATKQSDRKEKSAAPRNSNKQAAWK